MTDIWIEIIKQVPSLGVLVLLVIIFIRHLSKRDELLRNLNNENHQFSNQQITRMLEILKENTLMLGQNIKVLDNIYSKLSELPFTSRRDK
jgi:hypothetical protein